MATIHQLRQGLSRAWDSVTEGWQELRSRTAEALTRFSPKTGNQVETAEEQIALRGSRWGLLTADVREEEQAVVVRMEAPGMNKDDFEITVHDGRALVVRGEKRLEREESRGRYYVIESAYGSFERAVALPVDVTEEGARASYRRGVLKVTLPRTGGGRRRIEVRGN